MNELIIALVFGAFIASFVWGSSTQTIEVEIDLNSLRSDFLATPFAKKSVDDFVTIEVEVDLNSLRSEVLAAKTAEDFDSPWGDDPEEEGDLHLHADYLSNLIKETDDLLDYFHLLQEEMEEGAAITRRKSARNNRAHSNHSAGYKNRR